MKKKKHSRYELHHKLDLKLILMALAFGAAGAACVWVYANYLAPAASPGTEAEPALAFSEVMTGNVASCPAEDGGYYDWVELVNRSDSEIDLSEWKLGNQMDIRGAVSLPEQTLAPGERCVIRCDRQPEADDGVYRTVFALSGNAGVLVLVSPAGEIAEMLEVPAMKKGEAYALSEADGSWDFTAAPTPGQENSESGYRALTEPAFDAQGVYISELMASNGSTLSDAQGNYPDWIELYNGGSEAVSLAGWALTTDAAERDMWLFPEVTLAPGEYRIVYADAAETGAADELHADFKLPAAGAELYLVRPDGEIASFTEYEGLGRDKSLSRQLNGLCVTTLSPSPGYENSESGAEKAQGSGSRAISQNDAGVYINEVMCSMQGYGDWLELKNESAASVDLSGWWLSDNEQHPRKWEFPSGTALPAGGYLLVFLNGDKAAEDYQTGYLTADFALSLADNETVLLSRPDGTVLDSVYLKNQKRDVSYGRAQGYEDYRFFTEATPGSANASASYASCASAVQFSLPAGPVSGESATLELRADDGLDIYYTTDGSTPTPQSSVYSGPLSLTETTVVKAIAWNRDVLQSTLAVSSYIFNANPALRIVSVSGARSDLNGSGGVLNTGYKTKKGVYVEIFTSDGTLQISQGCELTVSGRSTREEFAQKAFRLVAKKPYGPTSFQAQLFSGRDYDEVNAIVLRASGQDCMQTHMRDSILTSLAADTEVFYQEAEPTVVYVNGSYWGLYYIRERVEAESICQFEGWDAEDADTLDIVESENAAAVQGSSDSYHEMMRFVQNNSLTSAENLQKLRGYCDVENYLDYVALQIYTANEDLGNIRAYRNPNGDGLWRWVLYDLDLSYQIDKNSFRAWLSSSGEVGSVTAQKNVLFYKLMQNDDMRDYFLTRFGNLLAATFSSENLMNKIAARYELIEAEMTRNCKKWKWSIDTWTKYGKAMLKYASQRPKKLVEYAQSAFKLSDAEVERYFGAAIAQINAEASGTTEEIDDGGLIVIEADVEAGDGTAAQ